MGGSAGADGLAGRSLGGGWSAAMWAAASSSNCINSVESLGARASWVLSRRCNTSMARQTAYSAFCLAVRRRRWEGGTGATATTARGGDEAQNEDPKQADFGSERGAVVGVGEQLQLLGGERWGVQVGERACR